MGRFESSCLVGLLLVSCATPSESIVPTEMSAPESRVHRAVSNRAAVPGETLEERAEATLSAVAASIGIGPRAQAALHLWRVHPLEGDAGMALWRAEIDGFPVLEGDLKVVLDTDGRVVAWSTGHALPSLDGGLQGPPPTLDERDAVSASAEELFLHRLSRDVLAPPTSGSDGWRHVVQLRPGPVELTRPGRVRAVVTAVDGVLRRAFEVEIWGAAAAAPDGFSEAHRLVIDAANGSVLAQQSLTQHAFTYRVWAETSGDYRPLDSPLEDSNPHATQLPDLWQPAYTAASPVSIDGLNGPGDPWLDVGATETRGNNVNAYTDENPDNGYDNGDFRAGTTSLDTFDHTHDPTLDPGDTTSQIEAAIVQAFYTTNWLHDWYYDSGFTEAAGNAQTDNYGRGGIDGDPLLVEVQDFSGTNNATMSTPADGGTPRMQMFIWNGKDPGHVDVDTGWRATAAVAGFGPSTFDIAGAMAEAGTDPTACTGVDAPVAGMVVLIDRGDCTFEDKILEAENAGAIGVIIVNNVAGPPTKMGDSGAGATLPSLHVSDVDGAQMRADLAAGNPSANLVRTSAPHLDSALDNTIVAHEWGHYQFGRLVSGCGTLECGGLNEGSADFQALHMSLRDGDAVDGTYTVGAYAAQSISADSTYFGLRRVPYSSDTNYNALSFRHISDGEPLPATHPVDDKGVDNSEVHNAGSVWSTAVFDAYLALQANAPAAGRTFDETRRRMSDIWVAGLALAPGHPTFLELRDALVVAAAATDPDDAAVLANAFANRGMGTCASGPTDRTTLTGVVEDFLVRPVIGVSELVVSDSLVSCDFDAFLDDGEHGEIVVTVTNSGGVLLAGATLDITFDPVIPDLTLPDGAQVIIPDLAPFSDIELRLPVALAHGATMDGTEVTVTVSQALACSDESSSLWIWTEVDVVPAPVDAFDLHDGTWSTTGTLRDEIWSHQHNGNGSFSWVGLDFASVSDTALQSPPMLVSPVDAFILTIDHRYGFEENRDVWWDGGVIELRVDGGPWTDADTWVVPGYDGTISDQAGNVLANREAFSGYNASWPALEQLVLDFGIALAGSVVEVRFRIGTDQAGDAEGWEIDRFEVAGIDDSPFPERAADTCDIDVDADGFTWLDDCDDADPAVNPAAVEICNGIDDNCDGLADDDDPGVDPATFDTWHADADGDGFGNLAEPQQACVQPPGTVVDSSDCDDGDGAVNPTATEVCNGVDDNCDGLADDDDPGVDPATFATWYGDSDGDGFGDLADPQQACVQPPGTVADSSDCDDSDGAVHPAATEVCNGVDDDCDELIDDDDDSLDPASPDTWYTDADADGFGDPSLGVALCDPPADAVLDGTDCDDTNADVYPGAPDLDDDCNGIPTVDTGFPSEDNDDTKREPAGCGCNTPGTPLPWVWIALSLVAFCQRTPTPRDR